MLNIKKATEHFKENDQIMANLLETALQTTRPLKIPKQTSPEDYFGNIVRSIVSQQISVKAAAAINSRVLTALKIATPEAVIAIDFDELKSCGLSEKKTEYIKHNATVWSEIPTQEFVNMTDQEIIAELTKLYGIGKWTAEMFLIFSMARPNVFSYGDLGLMNSLYKNYQYKPHYVRKVASTVESWSPHSTIASLTLWHSLDNEPALG